MKGELWRMTFQEGLLDSLHGFGQEVVVVQVDTADGPIRIGPDIHRGVSTLSAGRLGPDRATGVRLREVEVPDEVVTAAVNLCIARDQLDSHFGDYEELSRATAES